MRYPHSGSDHLMFKGFSTLFRSGLFIVLVLLIGLVAYINTNQIGSAQTGTLVINELDLIQSENEGDFIEIKNISSQTVSFEELSMNLMILAGEGGPQLFGEIALESVSIPAGGYFVICGNDEVVSNCDVELTQADSGSFGELFLPDFLVSDWADGRAFGMDLNGRNGSQRTELDIVAIGGPHIRQNAAFGESFISADEMPDTGDNISVSRIPDGQDTDTNLRDFRLCSPSPGESNGGACARAEIHLNAGQMSYGGGYFDPSINNEWSRDAYFNGGRDIQRFEDINEIENSDKPAIFLYERCCLDGYDFPLPNGAYQVKLHFMETTEEATTTGFRLFDVTVEGVKLPALDVFAAAGGRELPLVHSFYVEVGDEQLDIDFDAIVQETMINGIEIIPVSAIPALTATPSVDPTSSPPTNTPAPSAKPTKTPT
ncbi:MAG: malectin domain-containing carbohydrate-binding protein, partial [Chloroflexota bacterium]